MSNHYEWGEAREAYFRLRVRERALQDLLPEDDDQVTAAYVLVLDNGNGDGLALQGSRSELLDYLLRAHQHVAGETSRHAELGAALDRLRALRGERADVSERYGDTGYGLAEIRRLDESEVDLLVDVAEAAAAVYDDLTPAAGDRGKETR